jgi:DNA-binding NarL/FixJ family response regulator
VIDPQAITEAVWAARGPSIFLREDCTKSRQQQSNEIAWMNGSQPAHKGVEVAGKGLGKRRDYDVNAMVHMRRQGYTWRQIANKLSVSLGTVIDRVKKAAPELAQPLQRGPKAASQMVIRNQGDADKTGRIQGTGVSA